MPQKSFRAENWRGRCGKCSNGLPPEQIQESTRNLQDSRPEKVRALSTESRIAGAARRGSNPRRTPGRVAQLRCSGRLRGDLATKLFQPLRAGKVRRLAKVRQSQQAIRRSPKNEGAVVADHGTGAFQGKRRGSRASARAKS